MNKKLILASLIIGASASLTNAAVTNAPGDRIDAYTSPDTFSSILVDDIQSITYTGNSVSGYTHIVIKTADQTLTIPIDGLNSLVYRSVDSTPYEIKSIDDEHAEFRMLYNHNKPDMPDAIDPTKPYGWRGGKAGDPVFFIPFAHKGYTCSYTVTGVYSGKDYTKVRRFVNEMSASVTAMYGIGLDCLMYTMPFEPTIMTISSQERTDYEGLSILGTYFGGRIYSGPNRLRTATSEELTYKLNANTTFEINTVEDDKIELLDCYEYDEDKGIITNVQDPDDVNRSPSLLNVKWAITGKFADDNTLFLAANWLPENTGSNMRRYFALPEKSEFTVADGDEYGGHRLLEIRPTDGGEYIYYFFEQYGSARYKASVTFAKGTTISQPSVAYITYSDNQLMKYELTEGGVPVITNQGKEAGTYRYTGSGSFGTLTLDGFGEATLGGKTYAYTITNGVVTIELAQGKTEFLLDIIGKTYSEKADGKWKGAKKFESTMVLGAYHGAAAERNCTVTLLIDQAYNGTPQEGNAVIKVSIPRTDSYRELLIVGDESSYEYDSQARTITVTNIALAQWNGSQYVYGRYNIVFHVSEDLKTVTLGSENIGNRLWGIEKDGSYIVTGTDCILYANGILPAE